MKVALSFAVLSVYRVFSRKKAYPDLKRDYLAILEIVLIGITIPGKLTRGVSKLHALGCVIPRTRPGRLLPRGELTQSNACLFTIPVCSHALIFLESLS